MKPESHKAPLAVKKKERHIVSWSPEEDELLREQVAYHGIENWTSISAQFKDKTSRQCRRRWYTYLNSEGKKGGWSPEEDMLLCEAQKIFGNRWTEIAKVVSGRTDNAVKNRFSTLCKKRSKHEALSKENNDPSTSTNNKRILVLDEPIMSGSVDITVPMKHIRYHILEQRENHSPAEILPRRPLSVLDQNSNNIVDLSSPYHCDNNAVAAVYDGPDNKTEGSFLRKDDPKLTALLQQAEMLSSLALKVNSENTTQSLENAWKELNAYLIQNGGKSISADNFEVDFGIDEFNDLIEELKNNTVEQSSWSMQHGSEEYQDSSEYNATSEKQNDDITANQNLIVNCHQENELDPDMSISQGEPKECTEDTYNKPISEYDSPHQTVPTFKSLTEGIPTPNFTASEKQILFNILGMSSPAPSPNSAQRPSCKRALLESLG